MKRLICSIIVLGMSAACLSARTPVSYEINRNFFDKPFIFSPQDAMRVYEGDWNGSQSTALYRGMELGVFFVSQSYKKNDKGNLDCLMKVYSAGQLVASQNFIIYPEGEFLVLAVEKSIGRHVPTYIAETRSGNVEWHSYYPFMLFDSQTDKFLGVEDFSRMESEGFKYAKIPHLGFSGLIHSMGSFSKAKDEKKVQAPMQLKLDKDYFRK